MSAKDIFEATLIELSKHKVPSLTLRDFNYLFNKAINQYINKVYNRYDINQQTTDDMRVLKASVVLSPSNDFTNIDSLYNIRGVNASDRKGKQDSNKQYQYEESYEFNQSKRISNLYGATYEVTLPSDYLHMLNCVCVFQLQKNWQCYDAGSIVQFGATRLTADSWSTIINDFYNRPLPWRPYYYLHNVNTSPNYPYNPYKEDTDGGLGSGTDILEKKKSDTENEYYDQPSTLAEKLAFYGNFEKADGSITNRRVKQEDSKYLLETSLRNSQKVGGARFGNASQVRMEIRCGKDNSVFELTDVIIDYIKAPQFIRLTQEQVDLIEDTSQMMEFPDYVCQEIINELVHLVMENTADPRLPSHMPVTTSIASGVQQQAAAQSAE